VTTPVTRSAGCLARSLSQEHGVAIGTVKHAIEILRAEGLVRTVIGRGIFVTRRDGTREQ
jgi:DNA-binding GntR family transcriptional regulator